MGKGKTGDTGSSKGTIIAVIVIVALLLVGGMAAWLAINANKGTSGATNLLPSECTNRGGQIYGNKCYIYSGASVTANGAMAAKACEDGAGDLVSIFADDENAVVANLAFFNQSSNVWIGLHDAAIDGTWAWTTKNVVATYKNFQNTGDNTAPVNGYKDCVVMVVPANTGRWMVENCTALHSYVCKYDLATAPLAPQSVTAVADANGGSATVSWMQPSSDGGRTIANYTIWGKLSTDMSWMQLATATFSNVASQSRMITGLNVDGSYTFKMTATNAVGEGPASNTSNAVVILPMVPAAVSSIQGVAGLDAISFTFTPGYNGGRPITSYTFTVTGVNGGVACGPVSQTMLTSSALFNKWITLTTVNDTSITPQYIGGVCGTPTVGGVYKVRIIPTNSVGSGSSTASGNFTVLALPKLNATSQTGGFRQMTVTWAQPPTVAGFVRYDVITEVNSNDTIIQTTPQTTQSTPNVVVTGLVTGYSYKHAVRVCNGATSCGPVSYTASTILFPVAPAQVVITDVNAIGRTATVNFSKLQDNDDPITNMTVTLTQYDVTTDVRVDTYMADSNTDHVVVGGLRPGIPTQFQIQVMNGYGWSTISTPSMNVTAQSSIPDEPSAVSGTPGPKYAQLSWQVPVYDGFNTIGVTPPNIPWYVAYIVGMEATNSTTFDSSVSTICPTPTTPGSVCTGRYYGLQYNTAYQFVMKSMLNATISSASSIPTAWITPQNIAPGVPTGLTVAPIRSGIHASWTAPADDGGAAITNYKVELDIFNNPTYSKVAEYMPTDVMIDITGLTPGTTYRVRVNAINSVGPGSFTGYSSNQAAGADVPAAPESITLAPGNKEVVLTFPTPGNNGDALTSFMVKTFNDQDAVIKTQNFTVDAGTTQSVTVTGLKNQQAVTFTVAAGNGVGLGPESARTQAVKPDYSLLAQTWVKAAGAAIMAFAILGGIGATIYYLKTNDKFCWQTSQGSSSQANITSAPSGTELTGGASDKSKNGYTDVPSSPTPVPEESSPKPTSD